MALTPGIRLGPYEITAKLGEGGMGEVYRARDSKLGRDVAIKILPAAVAQDADRLARFEREAKTLAALNHANIAQIHGLEERDGITALVMELVEGADLTTHISRGPIALADALPIARQISNALEAAHEQGIIHRDLKPANIKVRTDGTVKVLDFGLAKALSPGSVSGTADVMNSPTLTSPAMTQAGVILGTAAYMSPEQARGRPVDRRADIWAFGVVLFEMLSGRRAFGGDDVSITLANVLKEEVDWSLLPRDLPASLRRLIERCLDKDPSRRLRDIGEARIQIEEILGGAKPRAGAESGVAAVAPIRRRRMFAHLVWGSLVIAAAVLSPLVVRWLAGNNPVPETTRFELELPPRTSDIGWPKISPDGRWIAAVAEGDDRISRIWIRSMDDVAFRVLAGTDGASYPFWAPDSRSIAFFSSDTLKKIAIAGGPPQPLCAAVRARGGTWGRAGIMLFSAQFEGAERLQHVAEGGGKPTALTPFGLSKMGLQRFPNFLPDGRHFLFFASARQPETDGVYIGSLDNTGATRVVGGFTEARYSGGFLFFVRDGTLMAQSFDPERRVLRAGDAFVAGSTVAEGANESSQAFSVSDDGTVLAVPLRAASKRQLRWFDRRGRPIADLGAPASHETPRISPDGRQTVTVFEAPNLAIGGSVWLTDANSGQPQRLAFAEGAYSSAIWSTDSAVIFGKATQATGMTDLFRQPTTGGATQELLLADRAHKFAQDVSPDGRYLVYVSSPTQSTADLVLLSLADKKVSPYVKTAANARIHPNGRWVAYASLESGRPEICVESFPIPGAKSQISNGGGDVPVWSRDGKELFYQAGGKLLAVRINGETGTPSGRPEALFDLPGGTSARLNVAYDVARDGRFLFNVTVGNETPRAIVALNWKPVLSGPALR